MQGFDVFVITGGYSTVWGCFELLPSHEPSKELSEKSGVSWEKSQSFDTCFHADTSPKSWKSNIFHSRCDKIEIYQCLQRWQLKGQNQNSLLTPLTHICPGDVAFLFFFFWTVTLTTEKVQPNLRSNPKSKSQEWKGENKIHMDTQREQQLAAFCTAGGTNLPCWDVCHTLIPSPPSQTPPKTPLNHTVTLNRETSYT